MGKSNKPRIEGEKREVGFGFFAGNEQALKKEEFPEKERVG